MMITIMIMIIVTIMMIIIMIMMVMIMIITTMITRRRRRREESKENERKRSHTNVWSVNSVKFISYDARGTWQLIRSHFIPSLDFVSLHCYLSMLSYEADRRMILRGSVFLSILMSPCKITV